jgi:hypothetical protein
MKTSEDACARKLSSHFRNLLRSLRPQTSRDKLALLMMLVFSLGCGLDHLTTVYGTSLPNIAESNPIVLHLMEFGVWSETEILIILMGIISGITIGRTEESKLKDFSMRVLTIVGFTRFIAAFNNIAVIIKALY